MSDQEIQRAVLAALSDVAPEFDASTLGPDADLRQEAELDSIDFLHLIVGLSQRLGVEVPEADYPELRTLRGCVAYLRGRAGGPRLPGPAPAP